MHAVVQLSALIPQRHFLNYHHPTGSLSFCVPFFSRVAPASLRRQKQLDEEKTKMAAMRPYQRKLYKQQLLTVSL